MAFDVTSIQTGERHEFKADLKVVPLLQYRIKGRRDIVDKQFPTAEEMEAFVNQNRAQAVLSADGNPVPGKFVRQSPWDWFCMRLVWLPIGEGA